MDTPNMDDIAGRVKASIEKRQRAQAFLLETLKVSGSDISEIRPGSMVFQHGADYYCVRGAAEGAPQAARNSVAEWKKISENAEFAIWKLE